MNLQTAIYNRVLEPKYYKLYLYIEELSKIKKIGLREECKKDICEIVSNIIIIKEKYKISYTEDLQLLEKYK